MDHVLTHVNPDEAFQNEHPEWAAFLFDVDGDSYRNSKACSYLSEVREL